MSAPMPTRRAYRPDSQYYRTTRRQSLRRGGGAAAAGKGLTLCVLATAGGLLMWWAVHGGVAAIVLGCVGLLALMAMAALVVMSGRR